MLRRRIIRNFILIAVLVVLSVLALGFKEIHLPGIDRESDGPLGLTLGLDLKGGSLLKYQADIKDEIDVSLDTVEIDVVFDVAQVAASIEEADVLAAMESEEIGHPEARITAAAENRFTIRFGSVTAEEEEELRDALEEVASVSEFLVRRDVLVENAEILAALADVEGTEARITASEENRFTIQVQDLDSEGEANIREALAGLATVVAFDVTPAEEIISEGDLESQLDAAVDTIQRRINALGTAEPQIQRLGSNRLVIQLPGIEDVEQAKALIGQTAQLVILERTCNNAACSDFTDTEIGDGLTGDDVRDAYTSSDSAGLPAVTVRFNSRGTALFSDLTRRISRPELQQSKRIAMFLDEEHLVAPIARAHIFDGVTQITGGFTTRDARDLAISIKSGAIPIPLTLISESTVDATLGKDSLDKSLKAGVVGLVLVLAFMLIYYRAAGLVATSALIIYALLMLAVFKMLPVTLTLAGIAGIILSIGMAVDANILIFERMKEELRTGRTLSSAMDIGFRRAWTAIFDGNVSTLITCGILWWLGSRLGAPQVTGFAITLGIGVAISMFTAVTVSRNLLQLMALTRMGQRTTLFTPEGLQRPVEVAGGEK